MKRTISLLLTVCFFSVHALGYGARGHALVGAIADKRLQKNPTVAQKLSDLLDGMTLEEAANLPDFIKDWDGCHFNDPPGTNPVTNKQRINAELRAFLNANPCSNHEHFHRNFHFTDVPVVGNEKYGDGHVGNQFGIGRNKFDIVQLITVCFRVLKGEIPATNNGAITKAVAIVLIAHYLGDIHQPLHVGAEYFTRKNGKVIPFEPSQNNKGFEDQGGNKLTLVTFNGTQLGKNLHNFWDEVAVEEAFDGTSDPTIVEFMASHEPANWRLNGNPKTWAEQMADDILPLAREAHDRLQFEGINIVNNQHVIQGGIARDKNTGAGSYKTWAAGVVRQEIQKGGWRLAALLEAALQ